MPGPIDYSLINVKPDPDTKEWWDGTKEDRLLVRLCNDCGHKFFPPFPPVPVALPWTWVGIRPRARV